MGKKIFVDNEAVDRDTLTDDEALEYMGGKLIENPSSPRRRSDGVPKVKHGDNRQMLINNLEVFRLPKINMHDVEQVRERVGEYFEIVAKNDMKPTVAGLALAFKVDRTTIWRIANGADGFDKTYSTDIRNVLKEAYLVINMMMEHYMLNGKINPVAGIFYLKNMGMGYTDQSNLVVTAKQDAEEYNAEDIRSRYLSE